MPKLIECQQDASKKLFAINKGIDKCLRLSKKGLLELVPDETKLTVALARTIVVLRYKGATILEISEKCDVSVDNILNWRTPSHPDYNEDFEKAYEMAAQASADTLEAESIECALDRSDDLYPDVNKDGIETLRPNSAAVQRSRLQVESFEKIAETENPAKHGRNLDDNDSEEEIVFVIQMVPTETPITIIAPVEKETIKEVKTKEISCQ